MGGERSAEMRRQLEAAPWGEIARRLTLFAARRLGRRGTIQDAQDLAFEAIRRVLDPDYADWDGSTPLLRALGSVVNGLIQNRGRSRAIAREVRRPLEKLTATVPSPAPAVEARQTSERALAALDARIAGDDLVAGVLQLQLEGTDKPQLQASRLGVPVGRIYNARRRLAGHVEAVRAQLEEDRDVEQR